LISALCIDDEAVPVVDSCHAVSSACIVMSILSVISRLCILYV